MKPILTFLLLGFLLISFTTQNPEPPAFVSLLSKFSEEFPQEKVYLHTDKPYYLTGETVWFQAYVTAGAIHQLSPLSKTLYVELINSNQEFIGRYLIRVENGLGRGQVPLARYLATGSYQLRAYTNWMRNFSDDFFFTKELKIWNADEPDDEISNSNTNNIDVQFFPEGGNLVAGIKTNVAFKAIGTDGLHREMSAALINGRGEQIGEVNSNHLGMGVFSLTPQMNEQYFLRAAGTDHKYPLPQVQQTGFVLTLIPKFDSPEVTIKLQSSPTTPNRESVTLVVHNRGIPAFIAQASLSNNLYFLKIPKAKLQHGLAHFTLFDGAGRPQANRLFFTNLANPLQVEVTTAKKEVQSRELTVIEIQTRDAKNQPVQAFVSLTATNNDEVIVDNAATTIENYLLLQSDLKGHIENPGYYFDETKTDRLEKLDLLLMTQGWVRFNWSNLIADQWPQITHGIEQGINIQGSMKDDLSKKGVEGGKVTYVPIEGSSDIVVAPTGKDGRFIFDALTFYDSAAIVLQGTNKKDKPFVLLEVDPIYPSQATSFTPTQISSSKSEFERFLIQKGLERNKINAAYGFGENVIVLDEVKIEATKVDESKENRVYTGASRSIKASSVPGAAYLFHPLELIRGVAGVQLRPNPPGYDVVIRGVGSIASGTTPLILLDNVPITITSLNQIAVESIESVDVFKGTEAAIFGSQGGNGVIAFFSKKGYSGQVDRKGVLSTRVGGYQVAQEFYVPKYDVSKPEHVKPDRRSTVFWSPAIQTDVNGYARMEYYNGDEAISVRIQAEGITPAGLMGVGRNFYRVKKGS